MTAPVQTQGPVDPNAGFRAKLYAGLGALTGIVSLIQALGIITPGQSTSIGQIITGFLGLLGAGGLAVAAAKTSTQNKNGTFDPAPPVPPAITAVGAIQAVSNEFGQLINHVTSGVQQVQDVAGQLGNLIGIDPGGLVDQYLRSPGKP